VKLIIRRIVCGLPPREGWALRPAIEFTLPAVERCLDLADLRQHLAEYYSHTERPSIDPELMIRMLVIGYYYGIRSERRLCEEVYLNLLAL
jgi:Transposase domain (DUF772)